MKVRSKILTPYLIGLVVLCVSLLCLTKRWSSPYTRTPSNMIIDTIDIFRLTNETSQLQLNKTTKHLIQNVAQQDVNFPLKQATILLYHKLHDRPNWWFKMNKADFSHCPHQCQVINDKARIKDADMLMFEAPRFIKKQENGTIYLEYYRDWGAWPAERGHSKQVRMFFAREPQSSGITGDKLSFARYMFNYTTTYQKDADIFYPYGFVQRLNQPKSDQLPDYGKEKSRHILWTVSNCGSKKRNEYKEEINKHMQVDVVGRCNKTHGDPCKRDPKCTILMRRKYKFYLAFEKSLCQEYVTEKFWRALSDGLVPIAMGAARKTYERVAPPHSFIHVDDFVSPQKLAEYLHILDKSNTLYNKYHAWRKTYVFSWESPNCELCRLATEKPHKITDITQAWNVETQCVWP